MLRGRVTTSDILHRRRQKGYTRIQAKEVLIVSDATKEYLIVSSSSSIAFLTASTTAHEMWTGNGAFEDPR